MIASLRERRRARGLVGAQGLVPQLRDLEMPIVSLQENTGDGTLAGARCCRRGTNGCILGAIRRVEWEFGSNNNLLGRHEFAKHAVHVSYLSRRSTAAESSTTYSACLFDSLVRQWGAV